MRAICLAKSFVLVLGAATHLLTMPINNEKSMNQMNEIKELTNFSADFGGKYR